MPLTVNTNIASLNTQRQLNLANSAIGMSLERLSSGLRINRSADDPAGLAIATKLQAQVRGLQQAARNANNAISLVQTAEGALSSVTNILQRLRELAVQAASDDNTDSDRTVINNEAVQLRDELTRLAQTVEFNGTTLLDGTFSGKKFQIGANANQTLTFAIDDTRATAIGKFATKSADVGDGIATPTTAGAGNLDSGEFTVNGTSVLTTTDSDDQVSILVISGSSGATEVASGAGAFSLGDFSGASGHIIINGTSIALSTIFLSEGAYTSTGSIAVDFASVVNAQSITNITARVLGSFVVLEATNGTNLQIQTTSSAAGVAASAALASVLGFATGFLGGTGVTTTTYNGQSSSIAKAAAVNGIKSTTSVSATVQENSIAATSAVTAATISSGDLFINGINIGALTIVANDSNGVLVAAINAQSANTGVTASVTSGKLTLQATDGRNITINATGATQTALGNSADITYTGTVGIVRGAFNLTSTANFTIGGTTTDIGGIAATTFVATGNLGTLSLKTRTEATDSITKIDSAIDSINSSRSNIGAVQSRLLTAVTFLDNAAENQAASESRIRDADFAFETAQFARAQILVQAATAILAQANAQPQVALQLLQ